MQPIPNQFWGWANTGCSSLVREAKEPFNVRVFLISSLDDYFFSGKWTESLDTSSPSFHFLGCLKEREKKIWEIIFRATARFGITEFQCTQKNKSMKGKISLTILSGPIAGLSMDSVKASNACFLKPPWPFLIVDWRQRIVAVKTSFHQSRQRTRNKWASNDSKEVPDWGWLSHSNDVAGFLRKRLFPSVSN